MVECVKSLVSSTRNDDEIYDGVFGKAIKTSQIAGLESLNIPRRYGRQTQRNNVPGDTPSEYFRRAIYLPFLDMMIQQLNLRFSSLTAKVAQALCLIPSCLDDESLQVADLEYFQEDLPSPSSLPQEIQLWKVLWRNQDNKTDDISSTLCDSRFCSVMFPNISKILNLLLLTSVTSSGVERSNSSLKFIKNTRRSSMGEDRLNALLLLYVHKDIVINYDSIIDTFARRNPRKMLLLDPMAD